MQAIIPEPIDERRDYAGNRRKHPLIYTNI